MVLESLTDPMWQFIIFVLIAIVTVIVSIIIYFKQRKRKKLSYKILSNTELLSLEEETKNDVQLSYKGRVVEGVKFLVLRIYNSGNLSIVSADYVKPITVEFGKETLVLTADVIKKRPPNLQSLITIKDHVVTLFPTLLNPSDSVTIKMLVSNYEEGLQINSRIVGVSRIEAHKEKPIVTLAAMTYFLLLILGVLASAIWSSVSTYTFWETFSYFGIAFYLLFIIAFIVILVPRSSRESFNKSFENLRKNDKGFEKENDD